MKNIVYYIIAVFLLSYFANAQDVSKLYPNDNEISGWTKSGKARVFAGEKLWEYIDGAAETYHPYGFKKVTTQDYKSGDRQITLDIYEFRDAKNAFGIYSLERDPKYNFIKVGVQGYIDGTILNFWKGNYYIKIAAFNKKNAKEDLNAFAKAVDKKITAKSNEPDAIKYFPKKNLTANSVKYFAKDMMGHSFFYNGYLADYSDGKNKYQIFILDAGNEKSAQNIYTAYKNYVTKSKGFEKDLSGVGVQSFEGTAVRKKVFAFYNAKIMAGITGLNDEKQATAILKEIASK